MGALDCVLQLAQDSELCDEFWVTAKSPLKYLRTTLGLTDMQIIVVAIMVEGGQAASWKSSKIAPILFFNEADAIFGERQEKTPRAVDKMENAIQNIILQEMENLDGILIATTNPTGGLDKAFERRFLFKVEFNKPSVEIKEKLWMSMFKGKLTDSQTRKLAKEYNFSGGEIENISRKHTIDYILEGKELDFMPFVGIAIRNV